MQPAVNTDSELIRISEKNKKKGQHKEIEWLRWTTLMASRSFVPVLSLERGIFFQGFQMLSSIVHLASDRLATVMSDYNFWQAWKTDTITIGIFSNLLSRR